MIHVIHSLWCVVWGIIAIYRLWDLYFCGIFKKFPFSFVHWYIFTLREKVMYVQLCQNIMEVYNIHVLQMWNDGQCGLWILFNIAHYFPHVQTIFIGHIHINYPLLECGCWIHNCICAWNGCHIADTSETVSSISGRLPGLGLSTSPWYFFRTAPLK